ncbi:MAG TPA: HAD family phosphatase [Corynebacteriales bacterium]|nr:HAD family phosphatase [Mycobacteriales bacterium]
MTPKNPTSSMSFTPGLVASDLDGTLLDSQSQLSQRTYQALESLDQRDIPFVVATGRPLRWLEQAVAQMPSYLICVVSNGAVIYDPFHSQILRRTTISPSILRDLVQVARELLPDACIAVERVHTELIPDTGKGPKDEFLLHSHCSQEWGTRELPKVDTAELVSEPAVKFMVRQNDTSSEELADVLFSEIGHLVNITYSIDGLVECSNPAATKGEALVRILDYFDLTEESMISFGDMPNDIDMLQLAAWGVAVENAHPSVKKHADEIGPSNDADGVAQIVERFLAH